MSKILEYNKNLTKLGTFITPKNEIIYTKKGHNKYALDYCNNINLTIENLKLYKLWLQQYNQNAKYLNTDFMIYILGFDKTQNFKMNVITTTSQNPHIKYYNYYLMDWHIDKLSPMKFNDKTGIFEYDNSDISIISTKEDRLFEEEINEIKSKVKLIDRPHFFK